MAKADSPYAGLPPKSFWSAAVRDRHFCDLEDISRPIRLFPKDRIATAGSCFAQHIGRHLKASGADYMDMEPRPAFVAEADGKRFGYDTYSCRYGNVYTSRQLLQLAQESLGQRTPAEPVWQKDGRFFDALRPSVDPAGHESPEHVLRVRKAHLAAVQRMLRSLDVFVFTLGLTEVWEHRGDGTAYPTAAGTIVGAHDPAKYAFRNLRYNDVADDMRAFWDLLRSINPTARMLLTVSPVPLAATASEDHVLVATTRSKATLRAVAGDLADDHADIYYFPSYELISSHPGRGMFFEPDLRNVNDAGVRMVMGHFFRSFDSTPAEIADNEDLVCEEGELDKFSGARPARAAPVAVAAVAAVAPLAAAAADDDDEDEDGDDDEDDDGAPEPPPAAAAPVAVAVARPAPAPAPRVAPPPVVKQAPPVASAADAVAPAQAAAAAQRRLVAVARERKDQIAELKRAVQELKQEVGQQRKALADAERAAFLANARAERSRQMLSFQLGAALLEGTRSFGSLAQLPARLLTLRREARRRKEAAQAQEHAQEHPPGTPHRM
ncbi:MAG: GSCFA domain-containing protein [Ramlibacter sp.]